MGTYNLFISHRFLLEYINMYAILFTVIPVYVNSGHHTAHNLTCYYCSTLDDKENCQTLPSNHSHSLKRICSESELFCTVIKFEYNLEGKPVTLWSVERNCSKRCEEGCIILGERTKLYLCRSCCTTSFCNIGSGGTTVKSMPNYCWIKNIFLLFILFLMTKYNNFLI